MAATVPAHGFCVGHVCIGCRLVILALALLDYAAAWDYASNGADWDGLGVCKGDGQYSGQSPIDLQPAGDADDGAKVFLKYPHLGQGIQLYNDGYAIAMTLPSQGYKAGFGIAQTVEALQDDLDNVYRLWQINFHAPSEHKLGGVRYPLEMQMMHQRQGSEGGLAVVSVLFGESAGAFSPFLNVVLKHGLPKKAWDEILINGESNSTTGGGIKPSDMDINFASAVGGSGFYSYTGSLTVPPCETEALYVVRSEPILVDAEQLNPFRNELQALCPPNGNYRDTKASTKAFESLRARKSVDVVTETTSDPAPIAGGPTQAPASGALQVEIVEATKDLLNNPATAQLRVDDDDATRAAKSKFHQARLEVDAARSGETSATQALQAAEGLYEGSPGYVNKIHEKWNVIGAQANLNGAKQRLTDVLKELEVAKTSAIRVIAESRLAKKKANVTPGPTSAPVEPGSDQVVTTLKPMDINDMGDAGMPKEKLNYKPLVELPRGRVSNPFSKDSSSVASYSATGGKTMIYSAKIAPNLQQPDGSPGQVAVPVLIKPPTTTTATTTTTTPGPMQIRLHLPIDPAAIADTANTASFKAAVATAVAVSTGVSPDRVEVVKVMPRPFQPIQGFLDASPALRGSTVGGSAP